MKETLQDLTRAVSSDGPPLLDAWEATALIESFGFNDRLIEHEFGMPDTSAAGRYIYERLQDQAAPEVKSATQGRIREMARFGGKFLSSFVYSVPWIVLLFFQWTRPRALEIAPDIAGPLSLALMGSLITSGGFIQLIARRGRFYLCLQEPWLARRICVYFLQVGFITSLVICAAALVTGRYFNLFSTRGLLIAAPYYLIFSVLWTTCAVLAIQGNGWPIPAVFAAGSAAFVLLKHLFGASALTAQTAAVATGLVAAGSLAVYGFRSKLPRDEKKQERMELPRLPVLIHLTAPYFIYGVAYFSFLFADRIAAGTAISWFSGLSFGIDSGYARGVDIALANFLVIAALVEALNFRFMACWYDLAKSEPNSGVNLWKMLYRRYALYIASIAVFFVLFSSATYLLLSRLLPFPHALMTIAAAWLGNLGYLLLALGLFNAVALFSLNRPGVVLRSILPGLAADFIVGYTLSHLFGMYFAVAGLVLGAAIFALLSTRGILEALGRPDYAYYAA